MKKLLIAVMFIYTNFSFAMVPTPHNVERLDFLAAHRVANSLKDIRTPLNNDIILAQSLEKKVREFTDQNSLLEEIYLQSIGKKEHFFHVGKNGYFEAGFDENFQSVIVNNKCEKYEDSSDKWVTIRKHYVIGLDGKIKEVKEYLYTSQHFGHNARYLTPHAIAAVNVEYNLGLSDVKVRDCSFSVNPAQNKLLQVHDYNRKIYLYDLSRCNQLKDFCENRMPFMQILLLSAIEQAKKQNRYLQLTEKEQEIFGGLLPEIKEVVKKYVVQVFRNNPSGSKQITLQGFMGVMRDVFLKPECRDIKYKSQ